MGPEHKDYSLARWTLQTVPALGLVILILATLIRVRANVGWGELARAAIVIFLIQAGAATAMYWARNYWRTTNDPRPGFALSGMYLIAVVPTGEYYASRWRLVGPQNSLPEAVFIALITFGWLAFWSWWRRRGKKDVHQS